MTGQNAEYALGDQVTVDFMDEGEADELTGTFAGLLALEDGTPGFWLKFNAHYSGKDHPRTQWWPLSVIRVQNVVPVNARCHVLPAGDSQRSSRERQPGSTSPEAGREGRREEGSVKVGDQIIEQGPKSWPHRGHTIQVEAIEEFGGGDADVLWKCLDDGQTWRTSAPWTRADRESEDPPED